MGNCSCGSAKKSEESTKIKRVYACSGCADVGEVADSVSRQLREDGFANATASCLVGIGAGIESFIKVAKETDEVITIDGCPIGCAKLMMEKIGINPTSYVLTTMGLQKGNAKPTKELVEEIATKIKSL